MSMPLGSAIVTGEIVLNCAYACEPDTDVTTVLANCKGLPVVICARGSPEILGIATPFDLL